nr:hypothetical protein [Tanacetum cinerariifolium]
LNSLPVADFVFVRGGVVDAVLPEQIIDVKALVLAIRADHNQSEADERVDEPVEAVHLPSDVQVVPSQCLLDEGHVDFTK